jgi:hypothetical protein
MASISKIQSAVLRDEVGEYLLLGKPEQSLSDSKFDAENELNNCAFLDNVINDRSDEDFIWENMQTYKGQRDNVIGSVGCKSAAKYVTVTETVNIFEVLQ